MFIRLELISLGQTVTPEALTRYTSWTQIRQMIIYKRLKQLGTWYRIMIR